MDTAQLEPTNSDELEWTNPDLQQLYKRNFGCRAGFIASVLVCNTPWCETEFVTQSISSYNALWSAMDRFENGVAPGSIEHYRSESIPRNIAEFIDGKVDDATLGTYLTSQGFKNPGINCYLQAKDVLRWLYNARGILPAKIAVTKGRTLYVAFRNPKQDTTLRLEIDEDCDVVFSIESGEFLEAGVFEDEMATWALDVLAGTICANLETKPTTSQET